MGGVRCQLNILRSCGRDSEPPKCAYFVCLSHTSTIITLQMEFEKDLVEKYLVNFSLLIYLPINLVLSYWLIFDILSDFKM